MERVTPTWAGNYAYVFCFLLVACVVVHVLAMSFGYRRSKTALGYISVVLAGLSIISISLQSHSEIQRIEQRALDWKVRLDTDAIRESIKGSVNTLCSIEYSKTTDSPPDFDKISESQKSECEMMKNVSDYSIKIWNGPENPFSIPDLGQSRLYSLIVQAEFRDLEAVVASYNSTIAKRLSYAPNENSLVKAYLLLFEPYFAALAMAYGLALVTVSRQEK